MMNYHDSVKPIARLAQELEMRNIIKCQDKLRNIKIYNEAFDPGSG